MTAVGSFLESPFKFLQDNVLIVRFEGEDHDTIGSDPVELTFLKPKDTDLVAKQLGRNLGVYLVVHPKQAGYMSHCTPDGRTFSAYFCPYRQGNTLGTMIGNKADYMFTTQMDGCSLGIGSAAPDGSRLVYHSNIGAPNAEAQSAAQNTTLNLILPGELDAMWEPKDYRYEFGESALCATTFGVRSRTTKTWKFYSQTYAVDSSKSPKTVYLREVKDVF